MKYALQRHVQQLLGDAATVEGASVRWSGVEVTVDVYAEVEVESAGYAYQGNAAAPLFLRISATDGCLDLAIRELDRRISEYVALVREIADGSES